MLDAVGGSGSVWDKAADTEPSIEKTNESMNDMYKNIGSIKSICGQLFHKMPPGEGVDPMEFLRKKIREDDIQLKCSLLDMVEGNSYMAKLVKEYISNAAIPQFLQAVAEHENSPSRKSKNPVDFDDLGSRLKSGLSGTVWKKPSSTSYYQNYGRAHVLRRPLETAFGDILYEKSTLEVLKDAKRLSHL